MIGQGQGRCVRTAQALGQPGGSPPTASSQLARRHAGAGPALPHGDGHTDGERELPSTVVRAAAAFVGGEHYFFDAPAPGHCGEWSFPRSGALPALQTKFLAQMKRLFAADIADWRPNGGSACEQAVVMAACKAGDAFVELAPEDGGHFGAAVLAQRLGIESFAFPMQGDLIDVDCDGQTRRGASKHSFGTRSAFAQPAAPADR